MDQKKMLDTNLLSRFAKNAYRRMHAGDNATLAAAKSYADTKAATGAGGSAMLHFKEVVTDVRTLKSWGYGEYTDYYREDFRRIHFRWEDWETPENLLMQNINKNNFLIYENLFTPTKESVIFYTYTDLIPDVPGGDAGLCSMKIILFNGLIESGTYKGYLDLGNLEKPLREPQRVTVLVNDMPQDAYDIVFFGRRFVARSTDGTIYNRWPGCENYNIYTPHTSIHPETNEEITIETALARTDTILFNDLTRQILVVDDNYILVEIISLDYTGHFPSDNTVPDAFNMLHFAGRDEVVTPAHVSTVNTIAINACNERTPAEYTFYLTPSDAEALPLHKMVILPNIAASLGGPLEGLILEPNASGEIRVLPYNNMCNRDVWGNPAIPANSAFVQVSQDYPEGEYSIVYFCNRFFAKDSSGVLHNRWLNCERFNSYTIIDRHNPDTGILTALYIGKARSEVVFVDDSNGRTYRANADGELVQFAFLNSDGKLPVSVIPQSLQCVQHYNGDASGSVVNQMPTGDFTVVYSTSYRRFFAKTANSLHRTWSTSNLFNNGEHPRTDTLFINDATGRILVADADGNLIELASLSSIPSAIAENAAAIEKLNEAMYNNDSSTLAFGDNATIPGAKIGPTTEIEGGYGVVEAENGMTFCAELEPGESMYFYARSYSTEDDGLNAHVEDGLCTGEVVPLSEIPDFAVLAATNSTTLPHMTADDLAENNSITNNTDETMAVYCSMFVPSEDNWPAYLALPQMLKHELELPPVEYLTSVLEHGGIIGANDFKITFLRSNSLDLDLDKSYKHIAIIGMPMTSVGGDSYSAKAQLRRYSSSDSPIELQVDFTSVRYRRDIDDDNVDYIHVPFSCLVCQYNDAGETGIALLEAITNLSLKIQNAYSSLNRAITNLTSRVAALEAASTATTATAQSDEVPADNCAEADN